MRTRTRGAMIGVAAVAVAGLVGCGGDDAGSAAAESGAAVSLTSPADGATLYGAVALGMTAGGVTIEPAGEAREGAGHFHLIADSGCVPAGDAIPKDADHLHFGQAQNEGVVHLEPGRHELCLQVGDGAHVALDVAPHRVTIDVGITDTGQWCEVIEQVDDLFYTADSESHDFATVQAGYESVRRLVAQLEAGIDVIEPSVRAEITEILTFATSITEVVLAATDVDDRSEVDELIAAMPDPVPGAAWILETCGVDVDS